MKIQTIFLQVVSTVVLVSSAIFAEESSFYGIISGTLNSNPYGSLVAPDGSLTSLQLLTTVTPSAADVNVYGNSIVGGADSNPVLYVQLFKPNGTPSHTISYADFPGNDAYMWDVAINNQGTGLVGGYYNADFAFASLISSAGVRTDLSITAGNLNTVALNNSGHGCLGGYNGSAAYAAMVSPDTTVTTISGLPSSGTISAAAINESGVIILGGKNNGTNKGYAAFVSSDGTLHAIDTATSTGGTITEVDINESGFAVLAGISATNTPYAALVSPSRLVTIISSPATVSNSNYTNAGINNSGEGIVVGRINGQGTILLFSPDGSVKTTITDTSTNNIVYCDINDAGVALVSGNSHYSALIAPNGALTTLTTTTTGTFYAAELSEARTPSSVGPYSGVNNAQLAASYALESHIIAQGRQFAEKNPSNKELSLLAARKGIPKATQPEKKAPKYTLWASPFSNYVHERSHESIPSISNSIVGSLLGFDYHESDLLFGGALGYAFNYLHYGERLGHANINEGTAVFYTAFKKPQYWMNFALWGGYYHSNNKRHFLFSVDGGPFTSTAKTHGWILSPHAEIATPIEINQGKLSILEPFLMFDWIGSWQHGYTESGSTGLNIIMDGQFGSLLRSELGLRFYEEKVYSWGDLKAEQKLSYVNQAPFISDTATTHFVGSVSTFPIAIGNTKVQNLAGFELSWQFLPNSPKIPYVTLDFQTEFGYEYQSFFGCIELGKSF